MTIIALFVVDVWQASLVIKVGIIKMLNICEKITALALYIEYKYICTCFIKRHDKPDCYKKLK